MSSDDFKWRCGSRSHFWVEEKESESRLMWRWFRMKMWRSGCAKKKAKWARFSSPLFLCSQTIVSGCWQRCCQTRQHRPTKLKILTCKPNLTWLRPSLKLNGQNRSHQTSKPFYLNPISKTLTEIRSRCVELIKMSRTQELGGLLGGAYP